jgi:hypothetical protein
MELLFNSQNATNAVNSDLVFWGDLAFAGNYNGFQTFDISRPASPTLVANVACLGPRRRVGWDRDGNGESRRAVHLLDRTLADDKCGSPAVAPDDPTGWEGIRTFDVSDPAAPRHLESVYQDCGSHTHALVPDPSTTGCCCTSSPTRCVRANLRAGAGPAAGRDPLHGVSQVIEVSRDPNDPLGGVTANEIAEPKLTYPGDLDNRFVWSEHGLPGPRPSNPRRVPATTSACTLASCWPRPPAWSRRRCGGSTPRRCCPTPSSRCGFGDNTDRDGPGGGDTAVDFWHTARFTWDGKYVQADDESFGTAARR